MPVVLFDDLDESTAWGWLEPVHDGVRKPLVGSEVTVGRADIIGEDDARGVSKYHFKVRHFPQGAGTIITDLSSNGTYINGVRIEKDKDATLVHADLITLAHATTARFAFRFCAPNKELPALGSAGSSHNVVGVLPARMASVLVAEKALLDAKQAEVDEWCAQFAAETGRQPQHAEKLAGIPSYKILLRLKRQQRRQVASFEEKPKAGDGGGSAGDAPEASEEESASPTTKLSRQTALMSTASTDYGLAEGEEATDGFGVAVDSGEGVKMHLLYLSHLLHLLRLLHLLHMLQLLHLLHRRRQDAQRGAMAVQHESKGGSQVARRGGRARTRRRRRRRLDGRWWEDGPLVPAGGGPGQGQGRRIPGRPLATPGASVTILMRYFTAHTLMRRIL